MAERAVSAGKKTRGVRMDGPGPCSGTLRSEKKRPGLPGPGAVARRRKVWYSDLGAARQQRSALPLEGSFFAL